MKTNILKGLGAAVIILTTVAFTKPMEKEMKVKESTITWKGKKVLGSHHGTIKLANGSMVIDGDQITDGKFVIDMTSINVVDLEGENKEKLEGHLKSDDFFGVEKHPTSTLVIKSGNKTNEGYYINGDITIKGITEPISFTLKMDGNTASTKLKINRTKFNVRYGSGSFFDNLGDNTIYDDFELDVTLQF
ncbi:YceI family protein [uncultured Planktosalinus sp.]|uniref:YceI family protein n=1 Tax=uncultured Planktosalinus sp. TaxID=1810935 RepID=UPI0030D719F6